MNGPSEPNPAQALEIAEYRGGEEILREGEISPFFFAILSGRVCVSHCGKKIRMLGEHDIFGLENLMFKCASAYSIIAAERCRIATYGPETLDHLIRNSPRMVQGLLISTLQQLTQTTYFLMDNPETLDEVRVGFFAHGETVMRENAPCTEFYRLVSTQGGLQVTMHGKEVARIERPGEFFGRAAGMIELPRQAAVTSIGESVVEIFNADNLDLLIRDHPDLVRRMLRAMLRNSEANRQEAGGGPACARFSGE